MEIGKTYIFLLKSPKRYFKGKVLSIALKYSFTVFTEGKTIGFTKDDVLGYGEDESELLYNKGTPEQVALQKNPHKMEMILLHAIQKNNLPLAAYISDLCDLSFMYTYKQAKGTAIEIALDIRIDDMVRLLIEKHAAFSQRDFLKMAIRKYPYPLQMFNVSRVKNMSLLFLQYEFTEDDDISEWDVSNVEDMSYLFYGSNFDGDILQWDVSKVKNMSGMFSKCRFDGDISQWDVSNVENMSGMFSESMFYGDLSLWNVSNVKNMNGMFSESMFDGDISQWDVSKVEYMSEMFFNSEFDGDLSLWDVSHVKNMSGMFANSAFQGDISQWDVSKVKDMHEMFFNSMFQGDISQWNVSKVVFMNKMFSNSDFDGDLSLWDVSNVKDMREMFAKSPFQQNISSWNSNGKKMENMFTDCPILEYQKPIYRPIVLGSRKGAGTRKVFQFR